MDRRRVSAAAVFVVGWLLGLSCGVLAGLVRGIARRHDTDTLTVIARALGRRR
jgi:hypothetical protein